MSKLLIERVYKPDRDRQVAALLHLLFNRKKVDTDYNHNGNNKTDKGQLEVSQERDEKNFAE